MARDQLGAAAPQFQRHPLGSSGRSRRTSRPFRLYQVRNAPRNSCLRRWSSPPNRFAARRSCLLQSTYSIHLHSSCCTLRGRRCKLAPARPRRSPCRRTRTYGLAHGSEYAALPARQASRPRTPPAAPLTPATARARRRRQRQRQRVSAVAPSRHADLAHPRPPNAPPETTPQPRKNRTAAAARPI